MASRPFLTTADRERLRDIADEMKYGPGKTFYVWSGSSDEANAAGFGASWQKPYATIDYAVGKCTANQGDVILVGPGHAETIAAAAGLALDVAGIRVIGLGKGANRPTLTLSATTSDIDFDAVSISMENILVVAGIDELAAPIDMNCADCELVKCEVRGTGSYAIRDCVDIGADRIAVRGCRILNPLVASAGTGSGININSTHNEVVIEDNYIWGAWLGAGVYGHTVATDIRVANNTIANTSAGQFALEFDVAVTGEITNNNLYANAIATTLDPGSCMCQGNLASIAIDVAGMPIPNVASHAFGDNAIQSGTMTATAQTKLRVGTLVTKAAAVLPTTAGATQALFTIATGKVLITSLMGTITTAITGGEDDHASIDFNATVCTSNAAIASVLGVTAATGAVGKVLYVSTLGSALASGAGAATLTAPFILDSGVIFWTTVSTLTAGAAKWDVTYIPIDAGASIS
jgi:hypothetical protein